MARRYSNSKILKSQEGKTYKINVIYPEIPVTEDDIYLITTIGDRYDTLALQFYKDPSLWWIIASANNYYKGSLNTTPGIQLRIPADKNQALQLYEEVNTAR